MAILNVEKSPKRVDFSYIVPSPNFDIEKPYNINRNVTSPSSSPSSELQIPLTNVSYHTVPTNVIDLRSPDGTFLHALDLENDGFVYTSFSSINNMRPTYEKESMVAYSHEMMEFLGKQVHADKIMCYDMRLRQDSHIAREHHHSRTSFRFPEPPINRPHMDHSRENGWHRVAHHLTDDEADQYLNGNWRVRIYNIWRPLNQTIQDWPLAICDPKTVMEQDMVAIDQIGHNYNGEIYYILPDKAQKWYWLSNQTEEEACIFLSWDSHPPHDKINYCPHSSFKDPEAPKNAAPRESVEVRLITFTKLT